MHCEAKMCAISRLIKLIALVQLSLVLSNGHLVCDYTLDPDYGYTCTLSGKQSIGDGPNDPVILGQHIGELNDSDVKNCDGAETLINFFPPIAKNFLRSFKSCCLDRSCKLSKPIPSPGARILQL